jgi:diguanylate cyclase (GGDEF)-like protein/PAS domain S-box-containing protein
MQSELLDITIIGCLVLLFASTYRKRATRMVRFWTVGWLLVLVHFAALLVQPSALLAQKALMSVSLTALVACGIVFLFAIASEDGSQEPHTALLLVAGASGGCFVVFQLFDVTASLPYYIVVGTGAVAWMAYSLRLRRTTPGIRSLLVLSTIASTIWLGWSVMHSQEDVGISAILAQLYLVVGLSYMGTFRRVSGGTLTVVFGLLAWASVFPAGEFCDHLGIMARISPEFWNVPKYFVAFGMILTLLEEEIIAANDASKHYRLLFEANPHPMWIYDRGAQAFEGVNDAALAQYGYPREKFLAMSLKELSATGEGDDLVENLRGAHSTRRLTGPRLHKKSDGSLCFVDVATHHMQSGGRDLAFSLVQDVTERQQLHERLLHQANHDLLTGLPNRACLEEKLRETLAHCERSGRQAALLCLDVDRFKQINDTYGHGVGDMCLQEVASRLAEWAGGTDVAARVGGEEFSVVLHEIRDAGDAEQAAAEILRALQAPIYAHNYAIELTASVGIAVCPNDGRDAATIWRNADCAMYRAKRAGGNQYLCMSPEISLLTSEANQMELYVRRALKEGGFEVHYQPLYEMNGELHSLEALVRFRHPEFGLISPLRFVPVAEETGLIVPLGSWVLNEVCNQSARWRREGLPPVRIALNISPLEITRSDFASHVAEVLAAYEVDPHSLGMEITETAMMRNVGEASRQIKLLADIGVAFSVDDFGTGYSSLGQLDKLAVQSLKIDRTFIDRICVTDGTHSIVDAIISMAHSLRLEVVAEGVETQEQWSCLRSLNCDQVQGFLFSKPLPAAQIPALLVRSTRPHPVLPSQINCVRVA